MQWIDWKQWHSRTVRMVHLVLFNSDKLAIHKRHSYTQWLVVIIKRCFKSATLHLKNKYYLLAACETAIQQKNNTKVCKCFMLPDNKNKLDADIYKWLGSYRGGRMWSLCRKSTISTYRALVNGRHCTKLSVSFSRI